MKILLLAGEESGEIYARQIRARLQAMGHEVRGYGDYGFKTEDLAVIGVDEVLRSLFYLLRVKRTIERAIVAWKPDVVCTIDYPGMHLKLAAYAKARGFRTVHVVCPQVWAWKAGRIPKIERIFDRLCCFLPFEPLLFKRKDLAVFVGHPLVEDFARTAAAAPKKTEGSRLTLALLPGSRLGEIGNHLPTMLKVLDELKAKSDLEVVIPAANEKALAAIRKLVGSRQDIAVQAGGARELLLRADCAVVASGTATLEAALAQCPTVLVYKAAPLFAFVARHVIKGVRFLGLANIIWDKCLSAKGAPPPVADAPMVELLQENLTVEKLRSALEPLVCHPEARLAARERLGNAIKMLENGEEDAIGQIVRIICEGFSPAGHENMV